MICDTWLCLDFPVPESGQQLLLKSSNLRRSWNKLLANKLEGNPYKPKKNLATFKTPHILLALKQSVESSLSKSGAAASKKLEMELWHDLAQYMNSEIEYTLKRLLPADMKVI